MDELQSALNAHVDQVADLVEKFSAELRSGLKPAYENFLGFFHAIDWKVTSHAFLGILSYIWTVFFHFGFCGFWLNCVVSWGNCDLIEIEL